MVGQAVSPVSPLEDVFARSKRTRSLGAAQWVRVIIEFCAPYP
jgi:hypothetical protein